MKGLIAHWKFQQERIQPGADVVTNGGFDADTDWTKGGSWSIAAGVAAFDASQTSSTLYQEATTVGATYLLTFEVDAQAEIRIENLNADIYVSKRTLQAGKHSFVLTAITDTRLVFRGYQSGGAFNLDNVSAEPISIADLTPQGNAIALYGPSFTTDRKGRADSALSFDGADDYCSKTTALGDSLDITDAITIIAAIRPDIGVSGGIVSRYNTSDERQYMLNIGTTGKITLYQGYNSGADYTSNVTDEELSDGVDAVIAAAWDKDQNSGIPKLYIDGVEGTIDSPNAQTVPMPSKNPDFIIGDRENFNLPYDGVIDEIWIFDRMLSEDEIVEITNSYKPSGALNTGALEKDLVLDLDLTSKGVKVGDDLLDGWDFTDGWAAAGTASVSDADTFTTTADAWIWKDWSLAVGRTYRWLVDAAVSAGRMLVYNASTVANLIMNLDNGNETDAVALDTEVLLRNDYAGATTNDFTQLQVKPLLLADRTPQGNHAEVWGGTIGDDGITFDGSEKIVVNDDPIFDITGDMILSIWIKPSALSGNSIFFSKYLTDGDQREWFLRTEDAKFAFVTSTSGTSGGLQNWLSDDDVFTAGEWTHVAAHHALAGTIQLYIDGQPVSGSGGVNTPLKNGTGNVVVGGTDSGATFVGSAVKPRIYKNADRISDVDAFVAQLYAKGLNG